MNNPTVVIGTVVGNCKETGGFVRASKGWGAPLRLLVFRRLRGAPHPFAGAVRGRLLKTNFEACDADA
jgi:hypothetical protein